MSAERSFTSVEVSNHIKKKRALAVNLSHEQDRIREQGSRYLPIFLDNMRSYTKETDTHAEIFGFKHVIGRMPDGSVRLYWDTAKDSDGAHTFESLTEARSSYLIPAMDESLPDWERARNMKDYEAILSLERMLETAKPGDTFIESSHAPFDQPDEVLEGTFYGKFSFIRTHTVDIDNRGREVLRGHAYRHYLDWQAQTQLHAQLAGGDDIQPENLLGRVDMLQPVQGMEDITDIEDIAAHIRSMSSDSFVPHERSEGPDEAAIDDYLNATQIVLNDLFKRLSKNYISLSEKKEINEIISSWRQSVRDFCNGIDRRDEIVAAYHKVKKVLYFNPHQEGIYSPVDELRTMYHGQGFREQYNSCGFGVGFNEPSSAIPTGMTPSYANLSYQYARNEAKMATGPDERVVNCPNCKSEVRFSRAHVIKAQELKCNCGASAKGCDVDAIAHNSRPVRGISYENMDTPIAA